MCKTGKAAIDKLKVCFCFVFIYLASTNRLLCVRVCSMLREKCLAERSKMFSKSATRNKTEQRTTSQDTIHIRVYTSGIKNCKVLEMQKCADLLRCHTLLLPGRYSALRPRHQQPNTLQACGCPIGVACFLRSAACGEP